MKSEKAFPSHVAIIMDGNGRWAKNRLLPRKIGHREGVKTIDRIADHVFDAGLKYLTLYAFSTENWQRPADEVKGLLNLFKTYIKKNVPKLIRKNIRLNIIGRKERFDDEILSLIQSSEERTRNLRNGTLNICFDYGGRDELTRAVNKLISLGEPVDEKAISLALDTADMPDPDILIRTGGEHRISNFLLYQLAYAEMFFIDTLWPDFSEDDFDRIVAEYLQTDRRFGRIEECETE